MFKEPEIAEWALREMDQRGQDIDEYCNENMYNIEDILDYEEEDDDDEDDKQDEEKED
ncbi:hypothetical protein NMZ80_08970 [Clostridioides difficile]|uniref:hypothetical protein n=1 Tax=Clostridioides difficile TaxID=1496 RepID=UPI0021C37A4D|nr:hypothetical protein [Clostridioides difficile]UUC43562.1 hypothetical protein NMZ80_08970 [Clostridioides difficile]